MKDLSRLIDIILTYIYFNGLLEQGFRNRLNWLEHTNIITFNEYRILYDYMKPLLINKAHPDYTVDNVIVWLKEQIDLNK